MVLFYHQVLVYSDIEVMYGFVLPLGTGLF